MSGTIFISYRRGLDSGFAGRLYDRLEPSFGRQRVFMDVDSIAPGEDFVAVLQARVTACDVLLALIGRGWITVTDAAGQRRLENPDDFVRIEIGAALAQGKRVIPVLSDDVSMPRAEDLPDEIKPLARRHAIRLTHGRFKDDAERLVRVLEKALADGKMARQPKEETRGKVEEDSRQRREPEHQRAEEEARHEAEATGGSAQDQEPLEAEEVVRRKLGEARGRAEPVVFQDIDASWCPEMVTLPAGEFLMGSPESEEGRRDNERPQHKVTIGYQVAMGRYPITFDEYDHFCVATKREKPKDKGWGRGRLPVINVSWHDAQAYCDWLAAVTSRPYRLPSEAEWEYACRAGTTTRYSCGDSITRNDANASVGLSGFLLNWRTTVVGRFSVNPWGLYDMHGNVSEWCADHWHDNYWGAPADGSAWVEASAGAGTGRVLRGGSWPDFAQDVRSASRIAHDPGYRYYYFGFRCARNQS